MSVILRRETSLGVVEVTRARVDELHYTIEWADGVRKGVASLSMSKGKKWSVCRYGKLRPFRSFPTAYEAHCHAIEYAAGELENRPSAGARELDALVESLRC